MDDKKVYYDFMFITVKIHGETIIPKKWNKKIENCVDRSTYQHYQMMCKIIQECNNKILYLFKTGVEIVDLRKMDVFGIEDAIIKCIKEYSKYFTIQKWMWDDDNVILMVKDTKKLIEFFGHENYTIHHFVNKDDWFSISKRKFEQVIRIAKYNKEL